MKTNSIVNAVRATEVKLREVSHWVHTARQLLATEGMDPKLLADLLEKADVALDEVLK